MTKETIKETMRLDQWLWAARFYKTRSLSANAIKRGQITVNNQKAKPAKQVSAGDTLKIRKAQLQFAPTIATLSLKRLSAKLAQTLYSESETIIQARAQRSEEIKATRQSMINGRPNKKERRIQQAIKRQLK